MSIRVGESEVSFSLEGTTFSVIGGERAITTPAREMSITAGDMPARWTESKVRVMDQPKFGQRDYAATRFHQGEGSAEKANISFETVVYSDHQTAAGVLMGTLGKMSFLKLSKVDLGDAGAMVEVVGHPSRRLRAIAFVERNVVGLIMLSSKRDSSISDSWLISMARVMASRMK